MLDNELGDTPQKNNCEEEIPIPDQSNRLANMSNLNEETTAHVRAKTLTLHWHEGAAAIYSVGTQPGKPGEKSLRLVTGGGDNNVRIWNVEYNESGTDVEGVQYLSSITKHTQAVNCVRFNKTGTLLATASDDGTIMIWKQSDAIVREFGQDVDDDIKESWVLKVACFASNMSEIYDICWSPDSKYICCGLMDNIIRIFSVATGSMVKQIAEHSHYVQGVAWDPRGEYICSQSADRSVHVYKVSTSESGELIVGPTAFYKSIKSEVPASRLSQLTNESVKKNSNVDQSPKMDTSPNVNLQQITSGSFSNVTTASNTRASTPVSSVASTTNGTINTPKAGKSLSFPSVSNVMMTQPGSSNTTMMEPPQAPRHKRTFSNSSTSSSHSTVNRCLSPLPLPAVMPSSPSHLYLGHPMNSSIISSNSLPNSTNNINSNTTSNTSNVLTSSVAYKQHYLYHNETLQSFFRRLTFSPDGSLLITTCGIYKPNAENGKEEIQNTVYVYTRAGLNKGPVVHLPGLRKPAIAVRFSPVRYKLLKDKDDKTVNIFDIKYRMLFAIATQDSVLIYDTQRLQCVAVATSLHYAMITDVAWSSDGRTIFVSSNDGFISCIVLSDDISGAVVGGFERKELDDIFLSNKSKKYEDEIEDVMLPLPKNEKLEPVLKRGRDIIGLLNKNDEGEASMNVKRPCP